MRHGVFSSFSNLVSTGFDEVHLVAAVFSPCSSGMWSSTKKIKDDRTANFFQATVSGDGERFPLFVLGGSQDVYENVFEWKERQQEGS